MSDPTFELARLQTTMMELGIARQCDDPIQAVVDLHDDLRKTRIKLAVAEQSRDEWIVTAKKLADRTQHAATLLGVLTARLGTNKIEPELQQAIQKWVGKL